MNIKDRIEELIGSIHGCQTKQGVEELQTLFKKKQKELGSIITPMATIRVNDAINGKLKSFEDADHERKEVEAEKKQAQKDAEIAAKMDKGFHQTNETEFFNTDVVLDESRVDACVIMDLNCHVPTKTTVKAMKMLADAAIRVGGTARLYVRDGGLDQQYKLGLVESVSPETVDVFDRNYVFAEVDKLLQRGVYRIFAMIEEDMVPEYKRVAQHFLREGLRFEIITYTNEPTEAMYEYALTDDYDSFVAESPFNLVETEKLYESILEEIVE